MFETIKTVRRETRIKRCLNAIAERVASEIEDINAGGCAIYAVELHSRLAAIGCRNLKIRTYGHTHSVNVTEVETNAFKGKLPTRCSDWNANGIYFHHVRLEWCGKFWGAEGAESNSSKTWSGWCILQAGAISKKAMELLIDYAPNWNCDFNRRQVPKLKRIMDECFKEAGFAV